MKEQIFNVKRDVLEAILDTARDGEAQVIAFSKDNDEMARRAAEYSKRKCGEIVEALLLILTGEEVSICYADERKVVQDD